MYIKLICIIIYNIWIDNYIIEFYNENNENSKINALLRQVYNRVYYYNYNDTTSLLSLQTNSYLRN